MGNRRAPAHPRRRVASVVAVALLAAAAGVLLLRGGTGGGPGGTGGLRSTPHGTSWLRASGTLTPGALNPAVTQATIRTTICRHGWTRTIRPPVSYTNELKRRQLAAWKLPGTLRDYQEDHFISLELGGHPTDERNLWPEPRPYAEAVDKLENELNRLVCAGTMTLRDAQEREARQKHERG